MGKVEEWSEPDGLLLNGLLPSAESVIHALDPERWLKAEERIAELIACIQPNQPSEERRNAVADYVQRLIMKCFPCQVFTFGSVPLKTYLPDGDIDVTAFSNNQTLKDTWANQVRDMLENEEKNEQAEFRVKEVQYIQAEVKIIKCLVENIVVDISFNQLGGLCTLCFLEEVDHLINQNHLFKRSIILIKAWCYYESRILGAPHGLISTYALETLVLYIFHVFNNSFTGPLEVLYRFLEFFGNFDWDNFCVSLWGPVPICSLPDVTVEPPRKDGGNLLLSKLFLDACSSVYAVFPSGQENHGQPFVSKHFNVIDPLRMNNNLGRSVSKGNFYRIRSAFAFGAKKLARLLECPKENIIHEVNQFFTNTWDRHGSGQRPDAPRTDSRDLKLSTSDNTSELDNLKKNRAKKSNNNALGQVDVQGAAVGRQNRYTSGSMSRNNDLPTTSLSETHTTCVNVNSARVSPHAAGESTSNHVGRLEGQGNMKSTPLVNGSNGRYMFARTNSSPELADTYVGDLTSQARRHGHGPPEGVHTRITSTRLDGNNRTKNQGSDRFVTSHFGQPSTNDASSVRMAPSHQGLDAVSESVSGSNSYHPDPSLDALNEELSSTLGTHVLHQEEQDIVNMMASTSLNHFNSHIPFPFNSPSPHMPFPIPPSFLASLGYTQQNMHGLTPSNVPSIDPSISNMQYPHGFFPQQLAHHFPGIPGMRLNPNLEYSSEKSSENLGSVEVTSAETENGFRQDQEVGLTGGVFQTENGSRDMLPSDERWQSTTSNIHGASQSWQSGYDTSTRVQQRRGGSQREVHLDDHQLQNNSGNDTYFEERMTSSRFSSASRSNSQRSSTPESFSDGSVKFSKSTKERRGKKAVVQELPDSYVKGKTMSEHEPYNANDDRVWNAQSNFAAEIVERNPGAPQQMSSFEVAQTSGSESSMSVASMFAGPGSWSGENPGVVFYPTGPPVPFLTMLPVYDETGASDTPAGQFGRDERLDDNDSSQNFDSEGRRHSEHINPSTSFRLATTFATSDGQRSDILSSDFASHFQNLQYGRFCQNPPHPGPMFYQTPVMLPPGYLQGRIPWDTSHGRPLPSNVNVINQLMGHGSRVLPVSPLSPSSRPPNVYQPFAGDMPKHRSGTGTYFPNPKISVRDRQPSNARRGNYNYDRNDSHGDRDGNWNVNSKPHGDRDGNWNVNSKPRASGRAYNRSQTEKSISRLDRLSSNDSRADRSWEPTRHESFSSFHSQNGPLRGNSTMGGAYGLYPVVPSVNPAGASSHGPNVPSVLMFYPFEHDNNPGSHGDQVEFGSIGSTGVGSSVNDSPHASDGSLARGSQFDEHRFHEASGVRPSSDRPSSPHYRRNF